MPKKKNKRKALIRQLDSAVSVYIIRRDGGRCVQCGRSDHLTCGHLFSRRLMSSRFDLLNCHCQCWGCNFRHGKYPEYYTAWFLRTFGKAKYLRLQRKAHTPKQWGIYELEKLLAKIKRLTEELPPLLS